MVVHDWVALFFSLLYLDSTGVHHGSPVDGDVLPGDRLRNVVNTFCASTSGHMVPRNDEVRTVFDTTGAFEAHDNDWPQVSCYRCPLKKPT